MPRIALVVSGKKQGDSSMTTKNVDKLQMLLEHMTLQQHTQYILTRLKTAEIGPFEKMGWFPFLTIMPGTSKRDVSTINLSTAGAAGAQQNWDHGDAFWLLILSMIPWKLDPSKIIGFDLENALKCHRPLIHQRHPVAYLAVSTRRQIVAGSKLVTQKTQDISAIKAICFGAIRNHLATMNQTRNPLWNGWFNLHFGWWNPHKSPFGLLKFSQISFLVD